jgi:aspartate/methionine/tyrosine aminotransferase
MLQAAGADFSNVVVFNSLSKRSNLPGLRVGLAAGDSRFIRKFLDVRNVVAPQVPGPLQEVAARAYEDEAHVEENRRLYKLKFDLADQIIGDRYGYTRPDGGFFLWLDVSAYGGSEAVALKLWSEAGVRILPGLYLAHAQRDGSNPAAAYIRVAMVHDQDITAQALHRIVATLQ